MIAEIAMSHNADGRDRDKAALRRSILAGRARVGADEARLAGLAVAGRVFALAQWRAAREALVYFAFRGEVDILPLVVDLWRRGVRVLAPRCRPNDAGRLDVALVACLEDTAPGTWGILEPRPDRCPPLNRFAPDVALIPAVAFDRKGSRLGFGQGYYDRLLAGPAFAGTLCIGVAHDFQVVDDLPNDPWDRPVDAVVTPSEMIWVESRVVP